MWDPTAHKITINKDVIFDESSLIKSNVDVQMKQQEVPKYQKIQFETSSNTDENEHEQVSEDVHEEVPAEENVDDDDIQQIVDDHCVYFKKLNNGIFIILVLYVDDMFLARKIITEINRLKAQMARTFDMKDLGATRQILDMEIFRDRRNDKLWLS